MLDRLIFYGNLFLAIPILPLLYWQGKQAKSAVPDLPPAQNPKGIVKKEGASKSLQILSLGESAFAGVGLQQHQKSITGFLAQSLAKQLKQNINWEVIAKSGYNLEQVIKELVPQIPTTEIDLIIIGMGANDTFEIHLPSKWEKDMKSLLSAIRQQQPDCPIVIAHLPPVHQFPVLSPLLQWFMGHFIKQYHLVNQSIVTALSNTYYIADRIDFDHWSDKLPTGLSKEDLFCDGVHPSEFAHQIWGEEIATFAIQQELAF